MKLICIDGCKESKDYPIFNVGRQNISVDENGEYLESARSLEWAEFECAHCNGLAKWA
jgi:hypothetical protein